MTQGEMALRRARFGETARRDAWWLQPAVTFAVFSAFVIYSAWAGLQGEYYHYGPYLSPFYSPELFGDSPHRWFDAAQPSWWPGWLLWSPAFLVVPFPIGFRLTCYYYRGAYYKAFWADPPGCAVGEPRKSYLGENSFPLILQNVHRYFLIPALALIVILTYDAWAALWFEDPATGGTRFGIGVGTIILALNAFLLGVYVFGCHSLRHLVGGGLDRMSQSPLRMQSWRCVTCLNQQHMMWAWLSLVWVGFTDLYVRLCAMGIWTDFRIL
jgi:hypothetical protein